MNEDAPPTTYLSRAWQLPRSRPRPGGDVVGAHYPESGRPGIVRQNHREASKSKR